MTFTRSRSKCSTCPLDGHTKVWGQGSFTSGIAVIGEAPGATEDADGIPFVGKAGQTMRGGLACTGTNPETVWFTNVIGCRPPSNELDSIEGAMAVTCCRPGLEDELKYLATNGIKVIIAVGNHAAHSLGIEGSITRIRGSVYEVK